MRHGFVVQHDGQHAERVALRRVEGSGRLHALQHEVAARQGVLGVAHGRVARGGVHHAHEHGRLLDVEFVGFLIKEGVGRRLDAVGVRSVLHRVEVHGGDLLLRVVVFEFEGRDPLLEFREHQLAGAGDASATSDRVAREEVLGQLLRDGRAAALRRVAQRDGLHAHAHQRRQVDARVAAEARILGGHERRDDGRHAASVEPQVLRRVGRKEVGVLHVGAVLHEERADDLAVLGVDFGREVAFRVFELLERGHAAEKSRRGQQQHDQQHRHRCERHDPDPADRFLRYVRLFLLVHNAEFVAKIRNYSLRCQNGSPKPAPTHTLRPEGFHTESLTLDVADAGWRKRLMSNTRSPPHDQSRVVPRPVSVRHCA